jgi:excisionase family DNA binding protein
MSEVQSTSKAAAQAVAHLPPLCTVTETAKTFRTSTRNVKRWIACGRLQAARVVRNGGSPLLIPRTAIEKLLADALG